MGQQGFKKFVRPEQPRVTGEITERDLDLIEVVLRYRFSPVSELARLVGGHFDVAQKRLRRLWEQRLVNRFVFAGIRTHSEFIYYLDNRAALELLLQRERIPAIHPQMEEEIRLNREADYARAVIAGQEMKLGFLRHALMISRMHFMLEMACRLSDDRIELRWRQGSPLRGHKVELPAIRSRRVEGSNDYVWEEHDNKTTRLPVEPDALFTLKFNDRPPEQQFMHFCYEADRGSMPLADMRSKFRAYYHFIKRQQKHKDAFGLHPIRAVLVETTDENRARKLMQLIEEPTVIGSASRSALFWFTISPVFTKPLANSDGQQHPSYLLRPDVVLQPVWALPDLTKHALSDQENH